MIFISSIIVLNVSIVLITIIAFFNITFVYQIQALEVYQLIDFNTRDYKEYLQKKTEKHEKKLNIYEYFNSLCNLVYIKYNVSNEVDFADRQKNGRTICKSFNTVENSVKIFYMKEFKEPIRKLKECTNEDYTKLVSILKNEINFKEPEDSPATSSYIPCFFKKKKSEIDILIKVLDEKLFFMNKDKNFYTSLQNFKNEMFNIKVEKANYPKKITNIDFENDKNLTTNNKKKVLTMAEVNFFKKYKFNAETLDYKSIMNYLGITGITDDDITETNNDSFNACWNLFNNLDKMSFWEFNLTRLSYKYIFPSQSDDLSSFIKKRQIVFKHLDNRKQIYTDLEKKINNVDQKYLDYMKTCRALYREYTYYIYVMRLIKNGCIPLGETEWNHERTYTGKKNKVAKFMSSQTKKNK